MKMKPKNNKRLLTGVLVRLWGGLIVCAMLLGCRPVSAPATPTLVMPAVPVETAVAAAPTSTAAPTATATAAPTATAVPPTPTVATPTSLPTTAAAGPQTIEFAPGAESGSFSGALEAGEEHEYRFFASAGQWATVSISSADEAANFALTGLSDGNPYKRLVNEDRQWSGPLLAVQEYALRVKSMSAVDYTLTLTIPAAPGPLPGEMTAVFSWVAQALQQGRPAAEVRQVLLITGWMADENAWQEADLTGDGAAELLLTLQDLAAPGVFGPPGDMAVLGEGGVLYRHFERYAAEMRRPPLVAAVMDMTGDGLPDAVIQTEFCGAHTCTQEYEVVSAHPADVRPLSGGTEPYAEIALSYSDVRFTDETGDGLPDIVLHGGFIGSVGAGPYQRGVTLIWSWDEAAGRIVLAETRLDPSNYRFHLLYEANNAFDAEAYETAIDKYSRVIEDETLDDGEGLIAGESTYDASRQFAAFRLMLIYTLLDNPTETSGWRVWLQTNYSETPVTEATTPFWETYNATGDPVQACAAVRALLRTMENPTGPLADLGYALPSLTAETVCPLGGEE